MTPATQFVTLRDGRRLAYIDRGPQDGRPVVHLHGGGHSRLTLHPDDALLDAAGIRCITVDRPGIGRSDAQRGRTIADWGRDTAAFADGLGLGTLVVSGHSMGGPFAVAAAAHLGPRVERLVLAGGLPPLDDPAVFAGLDAFNRRLYTIARRAPWLVPLLLRRMVAKRRRDPQAFHRDYYAGAPPADAVAAADPQLGAMLRESQLEAVVSGVGGLAREIIVVARPWGIDVGGVTAPAAYLYGADDHVVGAGAAAAYRALLGDAVRIERVEGAGHLIPLTHWPAMLDAIRTGGPASPAPGAPRRAP